MDTVTGQRKYRAVCCIRWIAGIYGGLLAALILTIAVGEGPPNPFTQPLPVAIELFGMLAILSGCIIEWKWQGIGAVLVIAGIMTFHVIEKKLWLMGIFPFFDLAGVLFLLSWWLGRLPKNSEMKKT